MAKQSFTVGQILTAAQMNDLQSNDFNQTVSTKTDNYSFLVADRGTRVVANKATAISFTVNNSIFSAGDTLSVHNINTGTLTLVAGSGVTIDGADVLTVAQWQGGTLYFTSASSAIWFPTAKTISSITAATNTVATSQTTSSTSYTDLATVGPTVTITTGTQALVIVSAQENSPNGQECYMDFDISGATTRSASDATALISRNNSADHILRASVVNLMTVTAGSNTFTAKYKVGGSTGTFLNRSITVIALPV